MQIQARSISRNLPEIVKKKSMIIKLSHNIVEFKALPRTLTSVGEAMSALYEDHWWSQRVIKESLYELKKCPASDPTRNILMDEIKPLEEAKEISLPNFLPRNIFLSILQEKVNGISSIPQVW
ncbi:hypothetical protein F8388_021027 [Cannabis sativa]|uniref:Uncharacterized protein n=1 Tax=Cannabis sativa TaxID=3483 RepID=A0A7J6DTL2_CANSA|nr:hypothetical protein F8388_021027 [Cannabis sativa]